MTLLCYSVIFYLITHFSDNSGRYLSSVQANPIDLTLPEKVCSKFMITVNSRASFRIFIPGVGE